MAASSQTRRRHRQEPPVPRRAGAVPRPAGVTPGGCRFPARGALPVVTGPAGSPSPAWRRWRPGPATCGLRAASATLPSQMTSPATATATMIQIAVADPFTSCLRARLRSMRTRRPAVIWGSRARTARRRGIDATKADAASRTSARPQLSRFRPRRNVSADPYDRASARRAEATGQAPDRPVLRGTDRVPGNLHRHG